MSKGVSKKIKHICEEVASSFMLKDSPTWNEFLGAVNSKVIEVKGQGYINRVLKKEKVWDEFIETCAAPEFRRVISYFEAQNFGAVGTQCDEESQGSTEPRLDSDRESMSQETPNDFASEVNAEVRTMDQESSDINETNNLKVGDNLGESSDETIINSDSGLDLKEIESEAIKLKSTVLHTDTAVDTSYDGVMKKEGYEDNVEIVDVADRTTETAIAEIVSLTKETNGTKGSANAGAIVAIVGGVMTMIGTLSWLISKFISGQMEIGASGVKNPLSNEGRKEESSTISDHVGGGPHPYPAVDIEPKPMAKLFMGFGGGVGAGGGSGSGSGLLARRSTHLPIEALIVGDRGAVASAASSLQQLEPGSPLSDHESPRSAASLARSVTSFSPVGLAAGSFEDNVSVIALPLPTAAPTASEHLIQAHVIQNTEDTVPPFLGGEVLGCEDK